MLLAQLPKPSTDGTWDLPQVLRGTLVALSHAKSVPHLGSTLSCIDIMIAIYWHAMKFDPQYPQDPTRDRFILSKGHAATALYVCLAYRGFFDIATLQRLGEDGGPLAEHPGPNCVPGVEAATGSLGHGLPIGLGHALAARIKGLDYRVFVLMSDGECNEGSVWEAAMMAAGQSTGNITTIVDYNKWQATGRSDDIMQLAPLADKWRAFGWDTYEIDGHDIEAIKEALDAPNSPTGRPRAIIAHTVKGKGISFMEDDNNWHYRIPTADEVGIAFQELGLS